MQKEWGRNLQQIDSPRFASYATLQRGKGYERECADASAPTRVRRVVRLACGSHGEGRRSDQKIEAKLATRGGPAAVSWTTVASSSKKPREASTATTILLPI